MSRTSGAGVAPKRMGNGWLLGTTIAIGIAVSMIPFVGPVISHFVERISNHIKAKRELDARADWYRNQIASTLGIPAHKVRGKHLEQAAAINPELAAAVRDVKREESKDNKSSLVANAAVAFIPVGGSIAKETIGAAKLLSKEGIKHTGKLLGATAGGGMLVEWTTKKHVSAQEVIEGISQQLEGAKAQGIDPKTVVTPNMVFALRVAQDEKLAEEIANIEPFKKPFHQLDAQQQDQIMYAYMPLANAAASEAHAISRGIMPVQELMARKPNLNGTAKYQFGTQAATFAGREDARRNVARGAAANDGSFAGRVTNERAVAAMAANGVQA